MSLTAAVKVFLLTRLRQMKHMCNFFEISDNILFKVYITEMSKERFPSGKTNLVWEASLICHTVTFTFLHLPGNFIPVYSLVI